MKSYDKLNWERATSLEEPEADASVWEDARGLFGHYMMGLAPTGCWFSWAVDNETGCHDLWEFGPVSTPEEAKAAAQRFENHQLVATQSMARVSTKH